MATSSDPSVVTSVGGSVQHIKEQEHDRPLLMRVMFGGGNNRASVPDSIPGSIPDNIPGSIPGSLPDKEVAMPPFQHPHSVKAAINNDHATPVDNIQKMTGGRTMKSIGGADPNAILAQATYFRKINTLFVILLFAIMFAISVTNLFVGMIFQMQEEDGNFEHEEFNYKDRWNRLIKLTIVFILMIIVFHFVVILLVLLYHVIKIGITNEDPNIKVFPMAWVKVKEMVWEYKDDLNNEVGLIGYYMLLFLVLIIMFVFFMIYTLLAKGYFSNIMYETVYNDKNPDVEDRTQQNKYLFQYAVYVLVMMLFVLLLLNYDKLRDKKLIFIYNIIFVMIYVILTLNILRFQLQRKTISLLVFLLLFLFMYSMYGKILKAIAKFMPK